MGKSGVMGIWSIGLILMCMSSVKVVYGAGISCTEAVKALRPCLPYMLSTAASPTKSCCSAVASVNRQANTKQIRQQLCYCFKRAAVAFRVNAAKAKQLPARCHVNVPVPIDPNVDCTKISFIEVLN